MTVWEPLYVWVQICNTAGDDANAASTAYSIQSMAGVAEGLQNRLWSGRGDCGIRT